MTKPTMIRWAFPGEAYMHWCEGCDMDHLIVVSRNDNPKNSPNWLFNQNFEKPTFAPPVLINLGKDKEDKPRTCHYILKEGIIKYCDDSSHRLAGKEVPLPPFPDSYFEDEDNQYDVVSTL